MVVRRLILPRLNRHGNLLKKSVPYVLTEPCFSLYSFGVMPVLRLNIGNMLAVVPKPTLWLSSLTDSSDSTSNRFSFEISHQNTDFPELIRFLPDYPGGAVWRDGAPKLLSWIPK